MKLDALKIDPSIQTIEGNVVPNTFIIDGRKLIYGEAISAEVFTESDEIALMGNLSPSAITQGKISETTINGVSLNGKTIEVIGDLLSNFFEDIEG